VDTKRAPVRLGSTVRIAAMHVSNLWHRRRVSDVPADMRNAEARSRRRAERFHAAMVKAKIVVALEWMSVKAYIIRSVEEHWKELETGGSIPKSKWGLGSKPMAMKNTRFVIFYGPEHHGLPSTHYLSEDGTPTDLRSKAAKFLTYQDAETFADQKQIKLTDLVYIGLLEFTDRDLNR
jgi:hypothetical protein